MNERKSYSINVRLRRIVTEDGFVLPLNYDVIDSVPDRDGQLHVDGKKVMEVAVRLGSHPSTHWEIEGEPLVEPHPIQNPPPHARN